MSIRDLTLSDVARLQARAREADEPLQMDEETFRAFYDRTARALWIYLRGSSLAGPHRVDDLFQETYYRFLRTRRTFENEAHRRSYLFRIATNVLRDARRRDRTDAVRLAHTPGRGGLMDEAEAEAEPDGTDRTHRRADLERALARLKPRDRHMLWLAYAQGSSHREIAGALGLKTASVKLLLFRARRRLATLLRPGCPVDVEPRSER